MSLTNADQIKNGIPSRDGPKTAVPFDRDHPTPQTMMNNGFGSSQSSRDSSPSSRTRSHQPSVGGFSPIASQMKGLHLGPTQSFSSSSPNLASMTDVMNDMQNNGPNGHSPVPVSGNVFQSKSPLGQSGSNILGNTRLPPSTNTLFSNTTNSNVPATMSSTQMPSNIRMPAMATVPLRSSQTYTQQPFQQQPNLQQQSLPFMQPRPMQPPQQMRPFHQQQSLSLQQQHSPLQQHQPPPLQQVPPLNKQSSPLQSQTLPLMQQQPSLQQQPPPPMQQQSPQQKPPPPMQQQPPSLQQKPPPPMQQQPPSLQQKPPPSMQQQPPSLQQKPPPPMQQQPLSLQQQSPHQQQQPPLQQQPLLQQPLPSMLQQPPPPMQQQPPSPMQPSPLQQFSPSMQQQIPSLQKPLSMHQQPPSSVQQVPPLRQQVPLQPQQQTQMQNAPYANRPPLGQYPNVYSGNRYPQPRYQTPVQQPQQQYGAQYGSQYGQYTQSPVVRQGFDPIRGAENYDLLQCPDVLPREKLEAPKVHLGQDFLDAANCCPDIFRCTMTKIPETNALLQKSRLPLGVLIHPFKDLNQLPVIQCNTIVRCRACRTYINPFVSFVDTKRWKCNLCYRVNDLPEEFQYDPVSKSYGDPSRRPEVRASTIEYIAPSEYMLRPPQPAVYLFLLDISRMAVESGYLHTLCEVLSQQLSTLPGDARTHIGFLAFNSTLHFFSLGEGQSQPLEMIVSDVDDMFLPCPDNLLVNLRERSELVSELLTLLPTRYANSYDDGSAAGAALQAALKMMAGTGGRVSLFQCRLPNIGPGALTAREDPNLRAGTDAPHLNPATDFYKRLALDCSGHQVAVDLFLLNSQYSDLATLSGVSRFSGGCIHHFPLFKAAHHSHSASLERCLRRYLTRKIGFEAVMRVRCTRGLSIHTFHGNLFVRSTDLLSLPNVNPDAGFGMQISIEESLADLQTVCFQAALLYTSSKGERRIRVHTLCLPVTGSLNDILHSADQKCVAGLLARMAVDRSLQSNLSDARDALVNAAADALRAFSNTLGSRDASGLLAPRSLRLLPLFVLALLKSAAFRTGQSTRLDDRVFAMCQMKSLPLIQLLQLAHPDLYAVHEGLQEAVDDVPPTKPALLQLSSRFVDSRGAYLMDAGPVMLLLVGRNTPVSFLTNVLAAPSYAHLNEDRDFILPSVDHHDSRAMRDLVDALNEDKPYPASLHLMREDGPDRALFFERLIEDRFESSLSYNEFLQHLKTQVY